MQLAFLCCFFLFSLCASSQDSVEVIRIRKEKQDKPPVVFDRPAYFKDSLRLDGEFIDEFIRLNTRIPEAVRKGSVSGTVYARFTVAASGKVSNIRILKHLPGCPACDAEVIRVIGLMPDWRPAMAGNKPVPSDVSLPVRFRSAGAR